MDQVEFYYNGKLLGYLNYPKVNFDLGRKDWDFDSMPFFIGYCPFGNTWRSDGVLCANGNEFYLKGLVYTTRLYTSSLTPDEIKLNYDMTLKYRDSFKDEKF